MCVSNVLPQITVQKT